MSFICQSCSIEQGSWTGSCPNCGSTRVLQIGAEETMVGRTVAGKYKILRKLGQGGVGSVYEGELEGIGQRVALKFLNPSFQMDSKTALRFLNEAKGLARLSHPNTVSLHDFGQDEEGHFFISMEFVEGADLRKFMDEQGRLSPADAIEVALQAADALGDAHGKGLVHRDVKPENIMVRRRTRGLFIKVLDFGLARLVEEGTSRLTNAGTLMGSLRYISPEQATGIEVDGRTDIYSLGVVLFEMLTGSQPFSAPVEVDLLRMHKETPMPHLWEGARDLALPQLDAVVQKATYKQPDARYGTMEELSAALSAALAELPDPLALKQIAESQGAATMKLPVATDSMLRSSSSPPAQAQMKAPSFSRPGQVVSQAGMPRPVAPAPSRESRLLTQDVLVSAGLQPSWARRHFAWLLAGGGLAAVLSVAIALLVFRQPPPPSPPPPAPLPAPVEQAAPIQLPAPVQPPTVALPVPPPPQPIEPPPLPPPPPQRHKKKHPPTPPKDHIVNPFDQ